MDFQIVEKGASLPIKDKAGATFTKIYVGAGWDMAGNKAVDLDLVGACLTDGKLKSGGTGRLVYFGDKTEPGVTLSADNTTGAGDGDDENMLIDLAQVEADVNSIAIGVAAYSSGADFANAQNFKFRLVNGHNATDEQVFEVKAEGSQAGDTVLHALNLVRGAEGWTVENVGKFYKSGNGTGAIQGFANLFA